MRRTIQDATAFSSHENRAQGLFFRVCVAGTVSGCLAFALTSCGSGGTNGKPAHPSTTASPSSTAISKEDRARKEVLRVYAGMRDEQAKAYKAGKASGTDLEKYAADKAASRLEGELFQFRQLGVVFEGKPTSTVTRVDLDLKSSPRRATVTECFDTTHWKAVEKSTGKDVTGEGQVRRYTVTGSAQTFGKRWMVVNLAMHKDQKC
jgi:hypothetical protein